MVNDDLVKCPFCGGFTHVGKPELLAALRDPKIRKQVEDYAFELLRSPSNEPVAVAQSQPSTAELPRRLEPERAHVVAQPKGIIIRGNPTRRDHSL